MPSFFIGVRGLFLVEWLYRTDMDVVARKGLSDLL
jgi:hypothetical protein